MPNPRGTALSVLLKIENNGAYSNLALNTALREAKLSGVDASFVSALVYGVLERQITLDHIIKQYSKIPLRKIETKTKLILRMGLYQLLYMDKVPQSAAVNESVNLAKKHRLQKSAGFINGILRSVARAEKPFTIPENADKNFRLSIEYSVPQELAGLWRKAYGEENAAGILGSLSGRPRLCARVNTLKTDCASLIDALTAEGVTAEPVPFLKDALWLEHTGSIEKLTAYREGLFHIQDASSQLCVSLLDPQPRDILLDVCSAPGGKAATAAQLMRDRGRIFACDLYEHKLKLISSNAERLGISCIVTRIRDAAKGGALPEADRILCDVPCSGLGILSRKPEIRAKSGLLDNTLPELQYKILTESAKLLAVGGRLVYSTCTLDPAENNQNAAKFLSENNNFKGVELTLPNGITRGFDEQPYEITLLPHLTQTDGFYISVFERVR